MNTMERINQLSAERARLYRQASNGHRRDKAVLATIKEISAEINTLWEQRRIDRIGRREGIDLVIDRVYEHTYGKEFEEAVAPTSVSDAAEERSRRTSLTRAA